MDREDKMAGYAQQGSGEALAPVEKIKLKLTIEEVVEGVPTFTLEGKENADKPHVNVNEKKITIPSGSRDVILEFHLDDDSGDDLEFCRADPIWVTRLPDCPQSKCEDGQIKLNRPTQKKKLTVTDLNTETVDLRYTLVLEGDGGQVLVDPIIRNFR